MKSKTILFCQAAIGLILIALFFEPIMSQLEMDLRVSQARWLPIFFMMMNYSES